MRSPDRAAAEARLHDARPAVADGERALALGLAAWGPSYPAIARSRRALGLLYVEQLGDTARGGHEIDLALQLFRDQLGADSIEVANCEQGLSQAGLYRGDHATALDHAERAEQIFGLRLGYAEGRLFEDAEVCFELLAGCDFGFVHQVLSFTRTENDSLWRGMRGYNGWLLARRNQLAQFGRRSRPTRSTTCGAPASATTGASSPRPGWRAATRGSGSSTSRASPRSATRSTARR